MNVFQSVYMEGGGFFPAVEKDHWKIDQILFHRVLDAMGVVGR